MEDLKGVKISTHSHTGGEILAALGAVPISLPPSDVYAAAQRHTIAGIIMEWNGVMQFKIDEVTTTHVESNLGSNTGFVLMNKGAFDKLPEGARAAIDRHAGAALAARYGRELESIARDQREAVGKRPGHEIVELSPAERQRWAAKVQPIYDGWIARTPNGAAVLAAFKAELARK
jgi:TRAP-type C4-dicarboxylate transport system substrate-binding protein